MVDVKDLEHILNHTESLWEEMRNQNIFITGGTGFFGCWLLESFTWINDQLNLNANALLLSRNPEAFIAKVPHLANHPSVHLMRGDVRSFGFPRGEFRFVIHAATDASAKLNRENPRLMFDTIVEGTKHTLEFARTHKTKKFLFTSSGAVYGEQPLNNMYLDETYWGAPDTMNREAAYGSGKRAAETLCCLSGVECKIVRCFAQVGGYLPLDAHYAIGNFIRDMILARSIQINGDGTPIRSYMYAADLVIWLWTILLKGQPNRTYNVGSDKGISILGLANIVRQEVNPNVEINVARKPDSQLRQRYVPSIERARTELGLDIWIPIEEAIRRTVAQSV
jgi:dTDP-glucose 4,6-dehydratase